MRGPIVVTVLYCSTAVLLEVLHSSMNAPAALSSQVKLSSPVALECCRAWSVEEGVGGGGGLVAR